MDKIAMKSHPNPLYRIGLVNRRKSKNKQQDTLLVMGSTTTANLKRKEKDALFNMGRGT